MLTAVGAGIAFSVLTEVGILSVTEYALAEAAPHVAWISTAVCAVLSILILRGGLRALAFVGLTTVGGAAMVCFVALPEMGYRLIPEATEVAREGNGRTELVGLRVQPVARRASHVLVCRQEQLLPGLVWNRVLIRMREARDVDILRYGTNQYECLFAPATRHGEVRSRKLWLRY